MPVIPAVSTEHFARSQKGAGLCFLKAGARFLKAMLDFSSAVG